MLVRNHWLLLGYMIYDTNFRCKFNNNRRNITLFASTFRIV